MEELIQKMTDLMNNKFENTFNIISNKTHIIQNFKNPIQLDPSRNYKLGLLSFSVFNNIQNIIEGENTLKYSDDNGTTWKTKTIQPGSYEISQLNNALNIKTEDIFNIEFKPNISINRVELKLTTNYQVDFTTNNNFREILGFNSEIYTTSTTAQHKANIENNVTEILIKCNIITGGYLNNQVEQILYSLPAYSIPIGFKLIKEPNKPVYLPLNTHTINNITLDITDQSGNLLNFGGEEISIRLHLKQV